MRFVDPLVDPEWDQLVLSHPDATFFHSAAWARVLAKSYGHKPFYLCFSDGGRPQALVPVMEVKSSFTGRRGVCLPFSDFCPPLLFNGSEPGLVVARLSDLARERNWKHFEIRDGNCCEPAVDPAVEYLGHTLDLRQSAEGLFAGFSSSVRRAIRKAEESKLSVEVSRSRESVFEFYRLHVQTRRRHGLPPQPLSFFRNIFDEVIRKRVWFRGSRKPRIALRGRSDLLSVWSDGDLQVWSIGACVTGDPGQQPCHVGRHSLSRARWLRIPAPSGELRSPTRGLRRFKLGWGTTEELIRYFQWDTGTRSVGRPLRS